VIRAEAAVNLAHAIDELPEDQRVAVRMRHLDGLGIDQIAEKMDKTPAAIAGLIRRGLQSLRERLAGGSTWL
jgi:RNA polymerase sigma-70 factor (ECF subfamily)